MTKKDNKYKYLEKQDLYKLYDIYYKNKRKLIQNKNDINDESYKIMKNIEDLEKEKPEYAIINTGIVEPPAFFKDAIKNFYKLVYQDSKFKLYKRI